MAVEYVNLYNTELSNLSNPENVHYVNHIQRLVTHITQYKHLFAVVMNKNPDHHLYCEGNYRRRQGADKNDALGQILRRQDNGNVTIY